jgi:hypothetical protein
VGDRKNEILLSLTVQHHPDREIRAQIEPDAEMPQCPLFLGLDGIDRYPKPFRDLIVLEPLEVRQLHHLATSGRQLANRPVYLRQDFGMNELIQTLTRFRIQEQSIIKIPLLDGGMPEEIQRGIPDRQIKKSLHGRLIPESFPAIPEYHEDLLNNVFRRIPVTYQPVRKITKPGVVFFENILEPDIGRN